MSRPLTFPIPCNPCGTGNNNGGRVPGTNVYYTGPNTINLNITNNTNLNEVINIIDNSITNILNHTHSIADENGDIQFSFSQGQKISFVGSTGTTISFNTAQKQVIISSSGTGVELLDRFRVGDVGELQAGATQYINVELVNKTTDDIMLFIDGQLLEPNLTDEFSYTMLNGVITFNSPLVDRSSFRLYDINNQTDIPATTSTTTTSTTTSGGPTTSTTSTSTTSTSSSSTTTTTTTLAVFDTILDFDSSNQDSGGFVTATIASTNAIAQFEFDALGSVSGLAQSMDIYIGGVLYMVVDFYDDYLGHIFRVTNNSGQVFVSTFINGTRSL
jgi:hypothetical protein